MRTKKRNSKKRRIRNSKNSLFIKAITNRWFLFIYLLIITLSTVVLHIYMQTMVDEISYYIDHTKKIERRTKQHITELRSEITQLSRADRIQRIATEKLNMVNSKPQVDVIVIK
ncbi:MAG: cell division protein FtsL [Candidatus Marinimicrobia bacterium]|nr:cell division protein FtsL [Candidatus Neomarinimicrobiota bacterium]